MKDFFVDFCIAFGTMIAASIVLVAAGCFAFWAYPTWGVARGSISFAVLVALWFSIDQAVKK